MTTGLSKPYETVTLTADTWIAITNPGYPVQGYYYWTSTGGEFLVSNSSDGSNSVTILDTIQPKPKAINSVNSGEVIEYAKSVAGDTLNIEWVPAV